MAGRQGQVRRQPSQTSYPSTNDWSPSRSHVAKALGLNEMSIHTYQPPVYKPREESPREAQWKPRNLVKDKAAWFSKK